MGRFLRFYCGTLVPIRCKYSASVPEGYYQASAPSFAKFVNVSVDTSPCHNLEKTLAVLPIISYTYMHDGERR